MLMREICKSILENQLLASDILCHNTILCIAHAIEFEMMLLFFLPLITITERNFRPRLRRRRRKGLVGQEMEIMLQLKKKLFLESLSFGVVFFLPHPSSLTVAFGEQTIQYCFVFILLTCCFEIKPYGFDSMTLCVCVQKLTIHHALNICTNITTTAAAHEQKKQFRFLLLLIMLK